jgi:hypothetical protein
MKTTRDLLLVAFLGCFFGCTATGIGFIVIENRFERSGIQDTKLSHLLAEVREHNSTTERAVERIKQEVDPKANVSVVNPEDFGNPYPNFRGTLVILQPITGVLGTGSRKIIYLESELDGRLKGYWIEDQPVGYI